MSSYKNDIFFIQQTIKPVTVNTFLIKTFFKRTILDYIFYAKAYPLMIYLDSMKPTALPAYVPEEGYPHKIQNMKYKKEILIKTRQK